MLQNIFLDDERGPKTFYDKYLKDLYTGFGSAYLNEGWVTIRNDIDYKKAIEHYDKEFLMFPEKISFDNDIQCGDIEGYHLLKWTLEYFEDKNKIKEFLLNCECRFHTANPTALKNMQGLYKNYRNYYLI